MGFYFRKSINLAKGVRLNLSKSGVSVSLGTKGARFTIGPKGTRTTFSIPNTGIYYTKNYSYKKKEEKENSVSCDVKQLDQYNDYLDNVTKLYKFSYNPIDWQKLSVSKVEYDDSEEIAAEKQYNEIKPNIFMEEGDEIFEKKKHQNYWSDNDDDDNEKKMFLKTNGLKIKIPHSKKEELKRQGNLNLFKYTGGINVKNLEYKDQLSSYKNIFVNQQIERKIFMNTTEKQISKYLNENNKNLSHQIKSKLMPNIKIINSNNRKILLIKEKNSDKIINGTNFNIIFNRK